MTIDMKITLQIYSDVENMLFLAPSIITLFQNCIHIKNSRHTHIATVQTYLQKTTQNDLSHYFN